MPIKKRTVPGKALQFMEPTEISLSKKKGDDGEEKRTASMLAYSGGVIKDHWYWGDLVIDVDGLSFDSDPLPILEDHLTEKKIGLSHDPSGGIDKKNYQLSFPEIELLDNPDANAFYDNSKQGFPYQSSVRAKPKKIEHLEEETSAEVNGMTVEGPATIFRQTTIKEASVCVFGWDSNTKSAALSEAEEDVLLSLDETGEPSTSQLKEALVADTNASAGEPENLNKEDEVMDRDELLAKYPDFVKELQDEAVADVEKQHQTELSEKDDQIATLTEENEKLSKTNEENQDRIGSLEKRETIRTEKELKMSADSIIDTFLSKSNIPERLYPKVRKGLDHNKFVESNVLDEEKFAEKAKAEVDEWNEAFKDQPKEPSVKGMSFSDDGDDDTKLSKENDDIVDRMLGYGGKKKEAA